MTTEDWKRYKRGEDPYPMDKLVRCGHCLTITTFRHVFACKEWGSMQMDTTWRAERRRS